MIFEPGKTLVHVSGPVYGPEETANLIAVAQAQHFTAGRWHFALERDLVSWFGAADMRARLVNSGSSANLLALAALKKAAYYEPGDEVITVACGFPTTVAPIVFLGLVPVFVDVVAPSYNVDVSMLEEACSPRTRAVMLAHTLGVPFDLGAVTSFCRKHGLQLIEDNCDAAGARYRGQKTGTFGDLSTLSFYPAHHMTTGEGGMVLSRGYLDKLVTSLRDWGRSCFCAPAHDNTCGRRFEQQHGTLPFGYDHKYCTPGDTLIETEEGLFPVAELARRGAWRSATMLDDGKLVWRSATAFPTTARDIQWITLRNGMELHYGWDHPVLTRNRGYVKAAEVSLDEEVAVAGALPNRADLPGVPDALLTVIGMLLADGCYVDRARYNHPPISWYKSNEECRRTFLANMLALNVPVSIRAHAGGRLYVHATGTRLHELLSDAGVLPAKAAQKRIPEKLTALSARQATVLIRALWSSDGMAGVRASGTVRITYGSRSKELCRGVQRLLFQCSILSTLTEQRIVYRGDLLPYYFVTAVGHESKKRMLDLLEDAPRVGNVEPLRNALSVMPTRAYGERNPSLEGAVWWVRVKWNTRRSMQPVFDVTVDDPAHNYVADGVVTHNCYDHLGFNMKMTEMQAAIGCAQLTKLFGFIAARRANWYFYRKALADLQDVIELPEIPSSETEPSWFGFLMTVREDAPFTRDELVRRLEARRIQTRPLFAGNILHHPAMRGVVNDVVRTLPVTDRAMDSAFWIGVYPGITPEMRDWVVESIHEEARR